MFNSSYFLEKIKNVPSRGQTKLIAIDGLGGSGKSTFARALVERDRLFSVLEIDLFPCSAVDHPFHKSGTQTRIDTGRLIREALGPLSNGRDAKFKQSFWWETSDEPAEITILAGGTVLVEGCYALLPELRDYYDLKIWVDCPPEVAMERAILRDGEEIREHWESVYAQNELSYVSVYQPMRVAELVVRSY